MPEANAADFFGEGTSSSPSAPTKPKRDWTANPPRTNAELDEMLRETGQGGLALAGSFTDTRTPEQKAAAAHGAMYYSVGEGASDKTRNAYAGYHENNQGGVDWGAVGNTALDIGRFAIDPIGGTAKAVGTAVGGPVLGGIAQGVSSPVGGIMAGGTAAGAIPTSIGGGGGGPAAPVAPTVGGGTVPTGPGGDVLQIPFQPTSAGASGAPGAGGTGGTPTGAAGDLLQGISTYQNDIYNLSKDNTGLSVAEAQLQKATELANIQAGIATDASQRSALGMARGARNRGDRALLERQAIGEAGYIGQDAARTDALRRATAEGDLSILRATESNYDREFKLKALQAAGELGLNTAALEIDLTKVNMQDATERMKIQLGYANLDADKARDIMNFTRDMASIQFEYDKLSVEDQNEADRLLMQKYGIDQQTYVALKQIKEEGKFQWDQVLTAFVGGAATGASGAGATKLMGTSDERVKTNIEPVGATAKEFDDFMSALSANTYEYAEPERFGEGLRFGFMAQDLEKTTLGKHMVKPVEGVKMVEIAPLAFATASGLALVHERLKELEKAVH
jgi:hypothetical protein